MPRIKARRCLCGCGGITSGPHVRFVHGHWARTPAGRATVAARNVGQPLPKLPPRLCSCGCGETTSSRRRRWVKGHNLRGERCGFWRGTVEERFRRFVGEPDSEGCRLWLGAINLQGYGTLRTSQGRSETAHRLAYAIEVGPLGEDDCLHHVCQRKSCVNPEHLMVVTASGHALIHAALRRELRAA